MNGNNLDTPNTYIKIIVFAFNNTFNFQIWKGVSPNMIININMEQYCCIDNMNNIKYMVVSITIKYCTRNVLLSSKNKHRIIPQNAINTIPNGCDQYPIINLK